AHAARDRRAIHAAVGAVAHPARVARMESAEQRVALAPLSALVASGAWSELADVSRGLASAATFSDELAMAETLQRLADDPALQRLVRLDVLASTEMVRRYEALWDRNGPRSGSRTAAQNGTVSRARGAAVEALAAQALEALASWLNAEDPQKAGWRVVTSMRVPPGISANADRAKSEWDAVLLRNAAAIGQTPVWDVCLLVEAKASLEAAS